MEGEQLSKHSISPMIVSTYCLLTRPATCRITGLSLLLRVTTIPRYKGSSSLRNKTCPERRKVRIAARVRSSAVYVAKPSLRTVTKPCSVKAAATNGCRMHIYCAGVSLSHYEALQDSPLPFLCSLCVQTKHSEAIEEMKATIAALREEVKELHVALERSAPAKPTSETSCESKSEWTNVVKRTRQRRPTRNGNNSNRGGRKEGVQQTTGDSRVSRERGECEFGGVE